MAVVTYAVLALIGAMLGAALVAPYSLLSALLVAPIIGSFIALPTAAVLCFVRSRPLEHQRIPNGVVWG